MTVSILALATAVPIHVYEQDTIVNKYIDIFSISGQKAQQVHRIYKHSAIQKRHSIIGDFNKPREEWEFWGSNYPKIIPGMSSRNLRYKEEAPKLAFEASKKALEQWGGNLSEITHLIFVSCTGMITPGVEYLIMQKLGLSSKVNRLGINFMGCFGAFKGLSVARAFALENPQHRILLVCTELCSLHLQADLDEDTIIGHSIFADGSAAVIIGAQPQTTETSLWEILRTHCCGVQNTLDQMSWEASDRGFLMRLSPRVPVFLARHIKAFVEEFLPPDLSFSHSDWAIHPGGKSILQAIEKTLGLTPDQTQSSWNILANYGNMSSATFLFVLEHLAQQPRRPWAVGLAFGPGLSVEGLLLRLPKTTEPLC
jgi:predicted naringenin-chalcone synthase